MSEAARGLDRAWGVAGACYAALFYAFLYVPVAVLIVLSFNDSPAMGFPLLGLTPRWYGTVLADRELAAALVHSLLVGAASATIATALALLIGLGLRREFPLKSLVFPVILVPLVMPGIVSGILLLVFAGLAGVPFGLWTTVLPAHVTWVLPFAFLTLQPSVQRLDSSLEEAAMDLGARPGQVFRTVILPILRPAVLATLLFSFTISFDEFVRTLFVISSDRTVPTYLWVLIVERTAPFLPAVGVVLMILSTSIAASGFLLGRRNSGTVQQECSHG
jgi:ABC-type spermidine/putrescine transport system permease subunit II